MTRFTDELFDDLLREHGPMLASTKVPAAQKRHLGPRPVLMTAGAGGLAVAATVGTLVAGGGTPAYAVTTHSDGTVSLAVHQQSGIAQANAKLHTLGDRVVVVPVRADCPSISTLPEPAAPGGNLSQQSGGKANSQSGGKGIAQSGKANSQSGKAPVPGGGKLPVEVSRAADGSVNVRTLSTPAGDILVLAYSTTASGMSEAAAVLTSGPVPSCVSLPAPAAIDGSGSPTGGGSGSGGRTGIVPGRG
ncbi:MAG: hypothetical protein ACRDOI_07920 [Trebonia sp.]